MELWDLYNEKREPLGIRHVRGEALPDGAYHIVVHVWIKNASGQFLMSQRAASRKSFPLMWETVGGSVTAGEDSREGALREVYEEIGIDLSERDGRLVFSRVRGIVDSKRFNDILDVWLFEYNKDADLGSATTDEVAQTKWLFPDEIKKLADDGKLVCTLKYFFDKIQGEKI